MNIQTQFFLISLVFILIAIIRIIFYRRKSFEDIISVELLKMDLVLKCTKVPTWRDRIPTFNNKFRIGDYIKNGGNSFANKYFYRKVLVANTNNEQYFLWIQIRKDWRGNYHVLISDKKEYKNN